jgi:hypothetical protein
MTSSPAQRLVALFVAVPLLAGCTAGTGDEDAPAQTDAAPDGAASESATVEERQPSPLDPYLDVLYGRPGDDVDQLASFQENQRLIAECMQEEGFTYTPLSAEWFAWSYESGGLRSTSRERVEQEGYGFNLDEQEVRAEEERLDPNIDYVATLSEDSLWAYNRALRGDVNLGGSDGGCERRALDATGTTSEPLSLSERWAPLVDSLNQMWEQLVPADPAWAEAQRDWSDCMAAAGYPGLEVVGDAEERAAQYAGAAGGDRQQAQRDEIAIALADVDCRAETSVDSRVRAVVVAAETQFYAQNLEQLNALLAEYEQGQ